MRCADSELAPVPAPHSNLVPRFVSTEWRMTTILSLQHWIPLTLTAQLTEERADADADAGALPPACTMRPKQFDTTSNRHPHVAGDGGGGRCGDGCGRCERCRPMSNRRATVHICQYHRNSTIRSWPRRRRRRRRGAGQRRTAPDGGRRSRGARGSHSGRDDVQLFIIFHAINFIQTMLPH